MFDNDSNFLDANETPLWERRSTINATSRSFPDVSMSANIEPPMRAASDLPRDRPQAIPLVQTLNENEDLKNRNQIQRLEIIRLKEIILTITGQDKFHLAEEFHTLKSREVEIVREKKEIEEAYQQLLENVRENKAKLDALEREKEDQVRWSEEISTAYAETKRQLDEARQRFPWMDESVDSIFGDANQRHIGDLKQRIEELDCERADLLRANQEMSRERNEALARLNEWSVKGAPGDKTFSVDVGDLGKVTYQEKIDELQHAIDERDAKIREQDQDYKKALRLLTNVQKSKDDLEKQVASLTMTMYAQTSIDRNELRESAIGTEERRMETASEWLDRLGTLGQENEHLKRALIELGGKYREMSMREGSMVPEEIDSLLNYADEVRNNLNLHQNLFNFTEQSLQVNDIPHEASQEVINQSIHTKESLDEMKEKVMSLKMTTRLLFERIKGASELFARILQHIKDDKSDFAEEIRRMTLSLDDSLRRDSIAALEEIEVAFNEASWVLEKSISESFIGGVSSLSQIMSRLGAGVSQHEINASPTKSFTKVIQSPRVASSSSRFVNKQTYDELSNKCDLLTKEFEEAKAVWDEEKQGFERAAQKCVRLESDVAALHRQLEVEKKRENEATLANSELNEEVERLRADETKFKQIIEENRRLIRERDTVIDEHETELNKCQDRQAKFEARCHEYLQKVSRLEEYKSDQESKLQTLRDQMEEFVAKRYKDLEAEYKYTIQTLSDEAEKATAKYQEAILNEDDSAKRSMEKCVHYEKLLTDAQEEISHLKKGNDAEFKQIHAQVMDLRAMIHELARLRGDNQDDTSLIRSHSENRSLVSQVQAQLQLLNDSMVRACDWTKRQMQKIHDNNRMAEKVYAQMRRSSTKRFKDPLRNEFYEICTRTDKIVQEIKSIVSSFHGKSGDQWNKVLEETRDLRSLVTAKYQALMEPKEAHVVVWMIRHWARKSRMN
ncbi:unnamed protein product, partial [Mesorhabditis belari]|uniref:Uncharacterized protein n=1 Tax=Mesorhabditis belari TaxID=2138241 RepID=A0AAF3FRH3_9BILA